MSTETGVVRIGGNVRLGPGVVIGGSNVIIGGDQGIVVVEQGVQIRPESTVVIAGPVVAPTIPIGGGQDLLLASGKPVLKTNEGIVIPSNK
jgi:hypothetical protein